MFYNALGRITWFGAKWYLRRRFGAVSAVPKPLVAGAVLTTVLAALLIALRREAGSDT